MADKLAVIQSEETIKELEAIEKKTVELTTAFNELVKTSDKISAGLLSGRPKDFVASNSELIKQQKEIIRLKKELEQLNQQELRTEQQLERNRQAKANADNAEIRLSQQKERQLAREQAKLQAAESLYKRVEAKLKDVTQRYNELATKKELGIRLTEREELSLNRLTAKQQHYDRVLKAVDATAGKYNRNVGNYKSGFDALGNSVAQITREAPAFAVSMNTGFLALSNNIPILAEAIQQARIQNEQLIASGQKGVPVWKQLAGALFSWQTALSVGITLLTVYGDDIMKFISNLFNMRTATDLLRESQDKLHESMADNASKSVVSFKSMQSEWNSLAGSLQAKNKWIQDNADKFHNLGIEVTNTAEAERLFGAQSDKFIEVLYLRARAAGAAQAAVETYKEALIEQRKQEKAFGITGWKSAVNTFLSTTIGWRPFNYFDKNREDKLQFKAAEELIKEEQTLMKEADALMKKIGIKDYKKTKKTREKKYRGASLTGEQRDALMDMEAVRDNFLAANELAFLQGLKTEKQYLEDMLKIQTDYHNKKIAYLKSGNAKERQLEARSRLDREKEIKETQKKIFELDYKQNEDLYKQRQNQLETQSKELENIDYLTDLQRLKKQVELDNQMISEAEKHWKEQIKIAKEAAQDTIEIERKRDEELNKLQLNRNQRLKAMPGALRSEFESRNTINANIDEANYEAERGRIERNRDLSDRQRSLELSRLELAYTINRLNKERQIKSELFASLSLKAQMGTITQKEAEELSKIRVDLEKSNNELQKAENDLNNLDFKFIVEGLSPVVDLIKSGFNDLGLDNIANQFTSLYDKLIKEGKEFKLTNEEIFKAAAAVIADFSNQLIENQKNRTIAALDEQLTYSQQKTEQEIGFIQSRLEYLNNLQDATEEQIVERNRLEDEARALREQQEMREKMIAKQKAKALQQAQAQQTLISGAQGAVMAYLSQLIPGVPSSIIRAQIAAAATLGFAALQSALIMSKDPVPQYYVGRDGGKAEWAYTQEKGREIITDKHGNIKSLGHDKGATMTWLDEGDKVYTAEETKKLLQNMDNAEIGTKLFRKIAREGSAMPIFVNNQPDNSDKIIKGVGSEFERVIRKYDKTNAYRNENGDLVIERGNRIPEVRRVKKEKINIIINNKNERD